MDYEFDLDSVFKTKNLRYAQQKIQPKYQKIQKIEMFLNLEIEQVIQGNDGEFIDKPKVQGEMTCNEMIGKADEKGSEKGTANSQYQNKCKKIPKNQQKYNANKEPASWHILTKNQTRTFVTHLKKYLQFLKQNYKQDKNNKKEFMEINALLREKLLERIQNPQQLQNLLLLNEKIVKYAKQFASPLNTFYKNQINNSKLKNKEFYLQQQNVFYLNMPANWSADTLNSKNN